MNGCDKYQLAISALLDGELEPGALPGLIRHLALCPTCRSFYERAQALQVKVDQLAPILDPAPDPRRAKRVRPGWRTILARSLALPRWAWVPLAVALLAIGYGGGRVGLRPAMDTAPSPDRPVRVQLGEDPQAMTTERFLSFAVDLLQASPRYRRTMFEILERIDPPRRNDEPLPGGDLPDIGEVTEPLLAGDLRGEPSGRERAGRRVYD